MIEGINLLFVASYVNIFIILCNIIHNFNYIETVLLILIPIVNYSKQLQCMVVKRLNYLYGFVTKSGHIICVRIL